MEETWQQNNGEAELYCHKKAELYCHKEAATLIEQSATSLKRKE
jgi:hypothetical protein